MTFPARSFRPAPGLGNAHLQTVWGRLARSRNLVPMRREVLETPDGDELVLDHLDGSPQGPRVVLLHGLEGSSFSVYVQGMLALLALRGARATVLNFRSCARDPRRPGRSLPNRRPRFYHSGETGDLGLVLRTLAGREQGVRLGALGVSLGGNVLLKWLGENPRQELIGAAATLSVPYDLEAGARHLERGLGALYVRMFLRTLRAKVRSLASRFPEAASAVDLPRALASRTFVEFDDAATAPLHGFAGATDYYDRSSSIRFLPRITAPVLCLSAEDDPFLPARVLPRAREAASPSVSVVVTPRGGHAGFLAGEHPWRVSSWGEETAVSWVLDRLDRPDRLAPPVSS